MAQFGISQFLVFEDSSLTSGGTIISNQLNINVAKKKTLYFKADSAGMIKILFKDRVNNTWDQVFVANTDADDLYVNTFDDIFPIDVKVQWTKTDPGEALIYFGRFEAEING